MRAEMSPCYSAPRLARVGLDRGRTGGPPRAWLAYGAATGRRVAQGSRGVLGRSNILGKARGLGWRAASAGGGLGRGRRGGGGALARATSRRGDAPPDTVTVYSPSKLKNSIFLIQVHKSLNTKVLDLTAPYNFHKGHMGFFSIYFAPKVCQL
jgi:hypothetical protein